MEQVRAAGLWQTCCCGSPKAALVWDAARWKCITMWGTPFVTLDLGIFLSREKQKLFSVGSSKWSLLRWSIDLFWDWSSGLKLMVDKVILKKQVTSYFLEKNITAITTVITDVWRKGWARSIGAWALDWEIHWRALTRESSSSMRWGHSGSFRTLAWLNGIDKVDKTATMLFYGKMWDVFSQMWDVFSQNLNNWTSSKNTHRHSVKTFSFCRTISGLTKVLVRLSMTLHTWSRIVMKCISSSRHLRSLQYIFRLIALGLSFRLW